ncbi:MAG: formate/nitrite transporter family protein [Verrucomicrobiales bacterium]|nr:formate/nitrite transporter family protein [Verrucomicrobiales bacterium]
MPEIYGSDAYSPKEIAERIEGVGVRKANLPLLPMAALGVLAGGFIGLGALSFNLVASDPDLGFAAKRVLGGVVFSLGLILVVVAGAELFTGNNLMVMARVHGKITTRLMLRNFAVVFVTNFIGACGLAAIVALSGHGRMNGGLVGESAIAIGLAKCEIGMAEAFFKGLLCNLLVCLAVWLAMAGRSVVDRVVAVIFPVSAFVAAGFEHSIANMYFVPLAIFLAGDAGPEALSWSNFLVNNLLPVTLGNLVGGAGMVGLVYHVIYGRE